MRPTASPDTRIELRIEDSNLGLPVQSRMSMPLDQSASKLLGQGSNLGPAG